MTATDRFIAPVDDLEFLDLELGNQAHGEGGRFATVGGAAITWTRTKETLSEDGDSIQVSTEEGGPIGVDQERFHADVSRIAAAIGAGNVLIHDGVGRSIEAELEEGEDPNDGANGTIEVSITRGGGTWSEELTWAAQDAHTRTIEFELYYEDGKVTGAELKRVAFPEQTTTKEARSALRETIRTVENAGVRYLGVEASEDDGGYLWARLGFRIADHPKHFTEEIRNRLKLGEPGKATTDDPLTPNERAAVEAILDTQARDMPQRIADLKVDGVKVGRRVLGSTGWVGEADLHDPLFRARLDHFLGAKKK